MPRNLMYKDAVSGLASKMTKKKNKGSSADTDERAADAKKVRNAALGRTTEGTADSKARRTSDPWSGADSQGIPSKMTGTHTGMPHHTDRANTTPNVYYYTAGSSNKSINDGKRFASDKEMKGSNRLKMEDAATGKDVEVWGEYDEKIKASDAIVKPRVRALARLKKDQESPDAMKTPRTRR